MFSLLTNLTKAVVAVAVSPVALVVDVVKLPVTAFDDKSPFENTEKVLSLAGKSVIKAIK